LSNASKHAAAGSAGVALSFDDDSVTVEVTDDGRGGASLEAGTGLRGLVDRVEAFGGELTVVSPRGAGTLVRAELPLRGTLDVPALTRASAGPAMLSTDIAWEPVSVLVAGEPAAGEELLSLLHEEYGATGARDGDWWRLTIRPIDQFRRGTIIYRVIQASRTLAERHPDAKVYVVTEDGDRWELPPPAL
jgi:hypothetical protein